jgi:hypothetical protein
VAAGVLAAKQPERSWQVWTRARLGGERRIDIARASGYKDGNAITQILKRLRQETQSEAAVAGRMSLSKPNSTTFCHLSRVDPIHQPRFE